MSRNMNDESLASTKIQVVWKDGSSTKMKRDKMLLSNVTQVTKIDFVYYTDVNHVTEKARRRDVSTH